MGVDNGYDQGWLLMMDVVVDMPPFMAVPLLGSLGTVLGDAGLRCT